MVGQSPESDESPLGGWSAIFRSLSTVDRRQLSVVELEQLAVAAYLQGRDDISGEAWQAAYERYLDDGNGDDASRCAFWLAMSALLGGRAAHASGWLGRSHAAVAGEDDCAASGLLRIPEVLGALDSGDPAGAAELAMTARDLGVGHGDVDLVALATLAWGQAQIAAGDIADGLSRLDEVMLLVESGRVGPIASGIVYCAVILECMQVFDLARATEWTRLPRALGATPSRAWFRSEVSVSIHQSQLQSGRGSTGTARSPLRNSRATNG